MTSLPTAQTHRSANATLSLDYITRELKSANRVPAQTTPMSQPSQGSAISLTPEEKHANYLEWRAAEKERYRAWHRDLALNPRPPRCRINPDKLMAQVFLDDELMDYNNPPDCSRAAFKLPRLRRCAFDIGSMAITGQINLDPEMDESRYDGGFDGYNWKIKFGSSGPFVLKVVRAQSPDLNRIPLITNVSISSGIQTAPKAPYHFALQRECQNAAVLQLMRAAIAKDDATSGPILVNSGLPWTRDEALRNLFAFSDEKRLKNKLREDTSGKTRVTSMPRTRQCYGWVKIRGQDLWDQVPYKWWHP